MRLIGDIGGTNVRFALADKQGNITEIKKYLKKDYPTIVEAVNAYKEFVKQEITEVALAVNSPIATDGMPYVTSNNWGYENKNIKKDIGVERLVFFNDLKAHSMSLPFLKENEKVVVHRGENDEKGVKAVVGPGTGLGLAYGIYGEDVGEYRFFPSEGGNQIASPVDEKQLEVIRKSLKVLPFVRWEDLSSGRGIHSLYKALFGEDKTTEDIMKEFTEGSEKSKEVFRNFCEFLGGFVHNVGAAFLPTGGIYIIGGILTRQENIDFLTKETRFLDYYFSESIYGSSFDYLQDYSIYLITHFNPALLGLANYKF